jgi:hypothetical protein
MSCRASCLEKVAHKRGVDNCFYDGVNISVRSDDEKIAASLPSAWLIQNGSSRVSEVVIKVAAMPSLWVFGIPKYTYEEVAEDGQLDRGSVLTAGNGSVPVRFVVAHLDHYMFCHSHVLCGSLS